MPPPILDWYFEVNRVHKDTYICKMTWQAALDALNNHDFSQYSRMWIHDPIHKSRSMPEPHFDVWLQDSELGVRNEYVFAQIIVDGQKKFLRTNLDDNDVRQGFDVQRIKEAQRNAKT